MERGTAGRLTQPAGADVLDARLPAGTEAFVGGIICAIGKESFRCHKAIGGHTLEFPRLLVHQCHGSGRVLVERERDQDCAENLLARNSLLS